MGLCPQAELESCAWMVGHYAAGGRRLMSHVAGSCREAKRGDAVPQPNDQRTPFRGGDDTYPRALTRSLNLSQSVGRAASRAESGRNGTASSRRGASSGTRTRSRTTATPRIPGTDAQPGGRMHGIDLD